VVSVVWFSECDDPLFLPCSSLLRSDSVREKGSPEAHGIEVLNVWSIKALAFSPVFFPVSREFRAEKIVWVTGTDGTFSVVSSAPSFPSRVCWQSAKPGNTLPRITLMPEIGKRSSQVASTARFVVRA
jgi:hypothetical protein